MNRRTYVGGAFRQKATPVLCDALQVAPSMKQILHFRPNFFGFTLPNIITNTLHISQETFYLLGHQKIYRLCEN